jgi:hypothetical protein
MVSTSGKGNTRRAAPAQWDRESVDTDDDDFKEEDACTLQRQQEPSPEKIYSITPLATRVPGPGVWPGQPI